MIAQYNRKSLIYGIPGIVLQIGGNFALQFSRPPFGQPATPGLGHIAMLVGTVLLLIGFAFYAKAKRRHPAWCLMAFLSVVGLIVLAALKDKAPAGELSDS